MNRALGMAFLIVIPATGHESALPISSMGLAQSDTSFSTEIETSMEERKCVLHLQLQDADSLSATWGLVRITPEDEEDPLFLRGPMVFERSNGWFAVPPEIELTLPRRRLRVEAVRGIETSISSRQLDFTSNPHQSLTLALRRIYSPEDRQIRSGNTHLHLRLNARENVGVLLRDRQEADHYLQTVGKTDGLDLAYVSYLTRPGETDTYISNSYTKTDFARLSHEATIFSGGVEHRHAGLRIGIQKFDRATPRIAHRIVMSYGHVMLLELRDRSMRASIGPGLADDSLATDGTPLRDGIRDARNQGASVIWCHGTQGLEDIPNWVSGLIHAQNIYDGGNQGSFSTVYYPYLNAGMKVSFSTGTDWGVFDFSRVYVPASSGFSSQVFLDQLAAGRSFITNEPFLEFQVNESHSGDTIDLPEPELVRIQGKAVGRSDFIRLQLVFNGRVVHETPSVAVNDHFESGMDHTFKVDRSGWLALRIQPNREYHLRSNFSGPGANILGKAIFAHTSPIYLTVAGRPIFDPLALERLIAEVQEAKDTVNRLGSFANAEEADRIAKIYQQAEDALQSRLDNPGRP